MTNPTAPPFAPLPVRARGTLEIFDTAFKLFRRYAGVLLAWSFLSSLINLVPLGFFAYVFTLPLFYGCAACVIAAAVRGQNVGFGQVWGFTKPRYGAILGVLILAGLLMFALTIGISLGLGVLGALAASALSGLGTVAVVVFQIVSVLGGAVLTSLILALAIGWSTLAPLVACLEDQHRGSSAMSRALSLMSGHWRKACAVSTILGLATTAILLILGTTITFLFYGGWDKFIGTDASDSAVLKSLLGFGGISTLFYTVSLPLLALVTGVFYLDLRTRKEALDLEWTNYAAKPEPSPDQVPAPGVAPQAVSPNTPAPLMMDASPSALNAGAIHPVPAPATASPAQPAFVPTQHEAPPIYIPAPSPATPAQIAPASSIPTELPEPHEAGAASFALQLEQPAAPTPAPDFPATPEPVAPTWEVASATPPAPVVQPAVAPPDQTSTSSFAPPRRVARADEDEDSASSFGSGARG